jgi:hypothetical protein
MSSRAAPPVVEAASFRSACEAVSGWVFGVGWLVLASSCADGGCSARLPFAICVASSFFAGASTAGSRVGCGCGFDARGLLRGRGMATRLGAACERLLVCDF